VDFEMLGKAREPMRARIGPGVIGDFPAAVMPDALRGAPSRKFFRIR
jgi:hypothetical protein